MVGRDIGTVVLPEAHLKIFMKASPEERARRRYRDWLAQGRKADYKDILAGILVRDELDRTNPVSPMVPAADAIIIETDNLSVETVLAKIKQLVAQAKNGTAC
jgi:cytidylate kinase